MGEWPDRLRSASSAWSTLADLWVAIAEGRVDRRPPTRSRRGSCSGPRWAIFDRGRGRLDPPRRSVVVEAGVSDAVPGRIVL